MYEGPFYTPRIRHQEGKTSWPRTLEKVKSQIILSGKPIEEEMQKERVPKESMTHSYEMMNSVSE